MRIAKISPFSAEVSETDGGVFEGYGDEIGVIGPS